MSNRWWVALPVLVWSVLTPPSALAGAGSCQVKGTQMCSVSAATNIAVLAGHVPAFELGDLPPIGGGDLSESSAPEATFTGPGVALEWQAGDTISETVAVLPGEEYVLALFSGGSISVSTGATEEDEGRARSLAPGSCTVTVDDSSVGRCQVMRAESGVASTVVGALPAGSTVEIVARSFAAWSSPEVIETFGPYSNGSVLDEEILLATTEPVELEAVLSGDGSVILSTGPATPPLPGSSWGDVVEPVTTETDAGRSACALPQFKLRPGPVPATTNQSFVISTANLPSELDEGAFIAAVRAAADTWNLGINDCGVTGLERFGFDGPTVTDQPITVWRASHPTDPFDNGVGFLGPEEFVGWSSDPCNPVENPCTGMIWPPPQQLGRGEDAPWSIVLNPDLVGDLEWSTDPTADADVILPWLLPGEGTLDVQSVLTHEFGHIAGLAHADTFSSCILVACIHSDPSRPLTMYSASRPGDVMHRTLGLGELRYLAMR